MKAWFEDRERMFWDGVREGELKGYKQLKHFAKRLKEKATRFRIYEAVKINAINETLNEVINKGDDN